MRRLTLSLLVLTLGLSCRQPGPSGAIEYFTITPEVIAPGASAQLEWRSVNAEGCRLTPEIGAVSAEGSWLVSPTKRTPYQLACNGATTVRVLDVLPSVHITSFTASPAQTIPDGVVKLTWVTEGADSCELKPGFPEVLTNGSVEVSLTQTSTFKLSCDGYGGPLEQSVTITVNPATNLQVPQGLSAIVDDGQLTLSWTQAEGATNVYFAEAPGVEKATVEAMPGGVVFRKVASPFVVTGLVNGRTYYFRVAAVSGPDETALSAEVSGAPVEGVQREDPYFVEQWFLGDGGQDIRAQGAWALGHRGEGIIAAIVDEGVDLEHEDLRQNVAVQRSYDYLGHAPVRWAEHGTCVAGLLAARDWNGSGVRGVAPRAAFVSFNVLQDLTSAKQKDAMTRGLDYVSVSSNSWGDADGTGLVTYSDPLWLEGVQQGATAGRGGKGVLYFWAAGNGGDSPYLDNANYDGQASSRFVFAITGYGSNGRIAPYAEVGANVLVSAPTEGRDGTGLTTTDITGTWGYNDGFAMGEHPDVGYTSKMNGTSASTPVAAGVGALILQARPELSYRDVRRVFAYSARKIADNDPDWTTNGAGLHINHKYGFGALDAEAAVAVARTIVPGGAEVMFSSTATPMVAIPDANPTGVSSTVTLSNTGVGHVEFVEVRPNITHVRTGDLELVMSHSGGASSVLHVPHSCEPDGVTGQSVCAPIDGYPFGSVRNLDEPGDGQWTLTVKDRISTQVGTLDGWTLVLYGRP